MAQDEGRRQAVERLGVIGRGGLFLAPPLIWAAYFVALYALQGLRCAGGDGFGEVGFGALTLAALAGVAASGLRARALWRRLREGDRLPQAQPARRIAFLAFAASIAAGLFFIATAYTGSAILFLEPCRGGALEQSGPAAPGPAARSGAPIAGRRRRSSPASPAAAAAAADGRATSATGRSRRSARAAPRHAG